MRIFNEEKYSYRFQIILYNVQENKINEKNKNDQIDDSTEINNPLSYKV